MQSGRFITMIGFIVPLTLPAIVSAQGSSGAQLFSSYDQSIPNGAGIGGFGLTLGTGWLGVRGTFGVTLSSFTTNAASPAAPNNFGRWTGDADLVVADSFLGLGNLLGGFLHPYGFGGVGLHSVSGPQSAQDAVRTWSYGGGVAVPISQSLALEGEMRNRSPLGSRFVSSSDFVSGREYRVGLEYHFGTSRTSSSYSPRPSGGGSVWPTSNTGSGAARRVIPDAERYIGVPYVYGGSTPRGFDCSGFVQYVYAHQGVDLPRTSRQMAGSGFAVTPSQQAMAVGDLMLFAEYNEPISHVAIYAGNGRFIHSSASGHGVRYDDLNAPRGEWFARHIVAARRVASGSGALTMAFAKSLIPFDHFDPPDFAPPPRK